MAALYMAGVVAQYISIKGRTPSVDIRARFIAHSKPIAQNPGANSILASLGRAGSGLVQVYDSIFTCATATPSQLALNDSVHFKGEHWITIKNVGKKVHKYTTTHLPVGTAQTSNTTVPGDFAFNFHPVPVNKDYASVKISPSAFTLAPGAEQKVKVTIKPSRSDQKAFPLYSGHIKFIGDAPRSSVTVPYLGLAADISTRPVLDATVRAGIPLPAITSVDGTPFTGEPVVDLSNPENTVRVFHAFTFGTPAWELAIVSADTVFDATIKHNKVAARSINGSQERLARRHSHPYNAQIEQHVDWAARAPATRANRADSKVALFSDVVTIGTITGGQCEYFSLDAVLLLLFADVSYPRPQFKLAA